MFVYIIGCGPACMGRHGAPDVELGFGYEHDKCTEEVI